MAARPAPPSLLPPARAECEILTALGHSAARGPPQALASGAGPLHSHLSAQQVQFPPAPEAPERTFQVAVAWPGFRDLGDILSPRALDT